MYGAQLCSLNAIELLHITNYYHACSSTVDSHFNSENHTTSTETYPFEVLLTIEGKCQMQIVEWVIE